MIEMVGTPRYPLSEPSRKQEFREGWGELITDEDLAALVRTIHKRTPFEFGRCYTNTEKLCKNAWNYKWSKLRLYPFAGWIAYTACPDYLIHHAWAILDGSRIIDMGCLREATRIDAELEPTRDAMRAEFAKDGKTEFEFSIAWRLKYVEALKPLEDGDPVDNRVWGRVPPGITYAGNPCHWDEALRIYNRWNAKNKRDEYVTPTQLIAMLRQKGLSQDEIMRVISELPDA